jgi:hypothetical protein
MLVTSTFLCRFIFPMAIISPPEVFFLMAHFF